MSFFEFPHTRTYDDDLGWLIRQVHDLLLEVNNKTINYADPIYWDITHQYMKYTVVIDPVSNTAYLSKQPVPQGIDITDTDYWQPVFDFTTIFSYAIALREQLAIGYEETHTSDHVYNIGELLFVKTSNEDLLYQVVTAISIGDSLVDDPLDPGYNIRKITFEELLGNLLALDTSTKTSLVDAINEIFNIADTASNDLGDIASLLTSDKTSAVNAINETYTIAHGTQLEVAAQKNVLIFGDSYCRAGYVTPGLEWFNLLKNRDGYTIYNYSMGGSGFAAHQSGANYIDDQINSAASAILRPDLIGNIIIFAGLNDYNLSVSADAVYAAMKTSIALARTKFPNAKICFVPFNWPYSSKPKYAIMQWLAACIDAGHESGVLTYEYAPFIFAGYALGFCVDGTGHPNAYGNELIYDIMRNMLRGNNKPPVIRRTFIPATYSGVTLCSLVRGFFELSGIEYKYRVGFVCQPAAYLQGVYRCAAMIKEGNQNGPCDVGWSRDLIYDGLGLDYSTLGVTFHTNVADGSLAATFAHDQTFGGTSQGYYRLDGTILDLNP